MGFVVKKSTRGRYRWEIEDTETGKTAGYCSGGGWGDESVAEAHAERIKAQLVDEEVARQREEIFKNYEERIDAIRRVASVSPESVGKLEAENNRIIRENDFLREQVRGLSEETGGGFWRALFYIILGGTVGLVIALSQIGAT